MVCVPTDVAKYVRGGKRKPPEASKYLRKIEISY
jgi:hypothetical protein